MQHLWAQQISLFLWNWEHNRVQWCVKIRMCGRILEESSLDEICFPFFFHGIFVGLVGKGGTVIWFCGLFLVLFCSSMRDTNVYYSVFT